MTRVPATTLAIFLLLSFSSVSASLRAQEQELPTPEQVEAARQAPLFSSHEVIDLTIEADFPALKREDRSRESEERPARIVWNTADGESGSLDIQIRTRGNFRLQRRNCDFPPLRLNVKKGEAAGTLFENQDKLKVVSPCKIRQDYWEQYVVLEYLTYRTLNALSDLSFRVRLARVTYVDNTNQDETFTRYAFLIEDDTDMAQRNEGRKQDWQGGDLLPNRIEPHHAILIDVFQYMMGNTDWSAVRMHNMELFIGSDGALSTVPFDFDFAGIVDARYASPDPSLPIRRVRQRLFRGFCPDDAGRSPEEYEPIYELFRLKKDEIYEMWRSQEGLGEDELKDSLEYFDDFYEILDDPGKIESRMMRNCRELAG
ncbi:hypothetical protein ACFL3S_02010 [Gemmatimonadota bacterium]